MLIAMFLACAALAASEPGPSVLTGDLPGPRVVRLGDPDHPRPPAGADATAALQALIDAAARTSSLAVVPSGTYAVRGTLHLWKDVRLIGTGPTKPEIMLLPDSPAFAGTKRVPVIQFCSDFPKDGSKATDANNDTFASGLINLAIRIGSGNPAAAAVRMRGAQLCIVQDCDLLLADDSIGFDLIANVVERTRIVGGRHAAVCRRTLSWQATMIDCTFIGQSAAAVVTDGVGMGLIRPRFQDVPVAVEVPAGRVEQLVIDHAWCENVATVVVADAYGGNGFHALSVIETRGRNGGHLLQERGGTEVRLPTGGWRVERHHRGLLAHVDVTGVAAPAAGVFGPDILSAPQDPPAVAVAPYPPVATWTTVRDHGAVGDGETDDTAAWQAAIASGAAIYVPPGRYQLSDTLELGAKTRLFSLHPRKSIVRLAAGTAAFQNPEDLRPVLLTAPGGDALVQGLGISVTRNPGAVALRWRAGAASRCADVWFTGDGGDAARGSVAISLHVLGGGGTFSNIINGWDKARHGFVVEDTDIPGRVELVSLEHRRASELILRRVRNWTFALIQTESSDYAQDHPAVSIESSRAVVFTNPWLYRTSNSRAVVDAAVLVRDSHGIEWLGTNVFAGTWNGGIPYRHLLRDADTGHAVPGHQHARVRVR